MSLFSEASMVSVKANLYALFSVPYKPAEIKKAPKGKKCLRTLCVLGNCDCSTQIKKL